VPDPNGQEPTAKNRFPVENYFNYFTEIEEHFQQRRGGILLLSTLDWALIETWKDAGIPLEAALRGVDTAFDKYDQRPSKTRMVNSLAYCAQEVLAAAEDMKEAAVGSVREAGSNPGFDAAEIAAFLRKCASELEAARLPSLPGISPGEIARQTALTLNELATEIETKLPRLEDLERRLAVLEERLFAVLLAAIPDNEVIAVRTQADRELSPYRSKMPAPQIEQLQKQYAHKKLLEQYGLPRLSLFYM
jgi:flagellar motility protein MotE (MotC chaperone)